MVDAAVVVAVEGVVRVLVVLAREVEEPMVAPQERMAADRPTAVDAAMCRFATREAQHLLQSPKACSKESQ